MTPHGSRAAQTFKLIFWEEATVMTRSAALWIAMAARIVVLSAFLLIWGNGLPMPGAGTLDEQFLGLDLLLLSVILPWIAVRCGVPHRRDHVTTLALATAAAPATIIGARFLTFVILLVSVGLSAMPVYTLVFELSAFSPAVVAAASAGCAAIAVAASALTTVFSLLARHRLTVWILTAATLVTSIVSLPPRGVAVFAYLAMGLFAAFVAAQMGNNRALYLPDEPDGLPSMADAA